MTARYPELPDAIRRQLMRLVVSFPVNGVTCSNVFWLYSGEASLYMDQAEELADVIESWLHGAGAGDPGAPLTYMSTDQGLATVRLVYLPPEEDLFLEALRFIELAGGPAPSASLPNNVAPVVRWSVATGRTHGRTYLVGFRRDALSGTNAQSIDDDRAVLIRVAYRRLLELLAGFPGVPAGTLSMVLRHWRVMGPPEVLESYLSRVVDCYVGSRRVCTQRRRLPAA